VDTDIDEQALREIYLPGFKAAIDKGESLTIMGAYNKLYGEHCSQGRYLLTKILREEWGYDGAVISDWGGVHDTKEAAESGLDIEMGSDFDKTYMAEPLLKAVREGRISEECIDKKIRNILRTMLRLKMLGEEAKERKSGAYNLPGHREAALEIARESVILFKNEDARLPIKKEGLKSIAVIGHNAQARHARGGGSAEIKALYEISPLMGIKVKLGGSVKVSYANGYYVPLKKTAHNQDDPKASPQELEKEEAKKKELFKEAVELAGRSDEVIFIGGLNHEYDTEGKDRQDMKLPYGQDELINAILDVNPNTIIVMVAGSPVDMEAWADRAKAIVWNYYNGIEGGTALADVLFGDENPSGKLPESFPKSLEDCPAHKMGEFGKTDIVKYKEGIFVGYRYYDTAGTDLRYCFGHGLSYTKFDYSDMTADVMEDKENMTVTVSLNVKNTGSMDGAEIVQLYVHSLRPSAKRPAHELRGFEKVFLKAGEEKRLSITLDKEAFGYYDTSLKSFRAVPGEYEIQAASSSRDIRLAAAVSLTGSYKYM
jgi:beta-glucosidase